MAIVAAGMDNIAGEDGKSMVAVNARRVPVTGARGNLAPPMI